MQRVVLDPDALLERVRDDPVAHDAQGLARQDGGGVAVVHRDSGPGPGWSSGWCPASWRCRSSGAPAAARRRGAARSATAPGCRPGTGPGHAGHGGHRRTASLSRKQRSCLSTSVPVRSVARWMCSRAAARASGRPLRRHAPPSSSRLARRRAWSVVMRVSMSRSRSPSMTFGRLCRSSADAMVGEPVLGEVVGPDLLRAVARADHAPADGGLFLVGLALLHLQQPGAQHGHRLGLVLVLALLVLDLDHQAARQVRDAHRGVGGVDALAARPGRTLDVDAQVALLVDLDLDLVRLGQHGHRRGRGMDAAARLGLRDALHAMDATLVLETAPGAVGADLEDDLAQAADAGIARWSAAPRPTCAARRTGRTSGTAAPRTGRPPRHRRRPGSPR